MQATLNVDEIENQRRFKCCNTN